MSRKAFTLVEILVVVIILGILAAIVLAQFSGTTSEARLNALRRDLQTVRAQLQLYRIEHGGYPDATTTDAWTAQMTEPTDADGNPGTDFGPYLHTFPTNPFNDSSTVVIDTAGTSGPGLQQASTCGWYFNAVTGKFAPNDETVAGHGGL